jgi:enterochelin esterase family protein
MDNLLAAKKVVPMLVVMENGYASRAGETRQQAADPTPPAAFEDLMIQDLIPMIDARYRTRTDRESGAIAGLSMGAGARHWPRPPRQVRLHRYFSGGFRARDFEQETSNRGVFMKPEMLNSQLKVFFVGTGTAELYYQYLKPFHEKLNEIGVRHVYFESPGTSHEYLTWRRQFRSSPVPG